MFTVTERTRQIGILKSLGMSKSSIAWVIEQEAIVVSLLGVGVGVLLTHIARLPLCVSPPSQLTSSHSGF